MRFTEFLTEVNSLTESLSPEERKKKIAKMKDDYTKYHGKSVLGLSKEERDAADAKHKAEKPQRRAAAAKEAEEHAKRNEETKARNKEFMARLAAMSPEERKAAAEESERNRPRWTRKR